MSWSSVPSGVTVESERNAVVVTLPAGIEIDKNAARAINQEYMDIVRRDEITGAMTILEAGVGLSARGFEKVEDAAAAGYALGIERWAIVTDEPTDVTPFPDHVIGLTTEVFTSKQAAFDWLNETAESTR